MHLVGLLYIIGFQLLKKKTPLRLSAGLKMGLDPKGSVACDSMAKMTYHKLQTQCLLFTSRNSLHSKLFTLPAESLVKNDNEIAKINSEK